METGRLETREPAAPSAEEPQWSESSERSGRGAEAGDGDVTLLSSETAGRFRTDWEEIQRRFVDEPRACVAQADSLVSDLMQRLTAGFSNERTKLEQQWDRGDDVSTEELRVALMRYRAFFERLLTA
jgi:hypothetical protein